MTNDAEVKLLPCPFCGNKAKLLLKDRLSIKISRFLNWSWLSPCIEKFWVVWCCGCDTTTGDWHSENKAIRQWNRRTTP